jgi:hypothetical protein
MSKEKQIEEMAKIFCGMKNGCDGCMWDKAHCNERNYAEEIYNAGYRKQEWISVDERLPEPNEHCLVAAKVGERMVVDLGERVWCFDYRTMEHSYAWSIMNDWDEGEGCEITHWMPLPEPPKMKGGAEE